MSAHPLALSVPPISEDLFKRLKQAHPPLIPAPNVNSIEEIMFNAGQQAMIEWLGQFVGKSVVTGG